MRRGEERPREWGGEGRGRGSEEGRGEAEGVRRGGERPREWGGEIICVVLVV